MVHVSVKAEEILSFFGFPITNSMILSWIVMVLFVFIGWYYQHNLSKKKKQAPFYVLHTLFLAIYNLVQSVLHDKVRVFFPLLGAYFFYILINNWVGMFPTVGSLLIRPQIEEKIVESTKKIQSPEVKEQIKAQLTEVEKSVGHNEVVSPQSTGETVLKKNESESKGSHEAKKIPLLRANTADLNTTFALALITVISIQYYGFAYNGTGYLKKFFNFANPIMFFVGILELISELARILSFSFRLFGNVLAGEILITIVAFLIPPFASFIMLPFYTLEIMAGAIQGLVFMMLSTVLIGMATTKAHH